MDQEVLACRGPAGEEIAYAVVGDGPVLVLAAWWTSHLELDWQNTELRSFVQALGENHTVVRYDRPGVGMSDRSPRAFDLETEVGHLGAVVDATGASSIDLLGISCGGPPCVALAAQRPELVRRMVFFGSYADGQQISDQATQAVVRDLVAANWGLGSRALTSVFLPDSDAVTARRFSSAQRHTTSAEVAADLLQLTFDMDVSALAADVEQPALVLHRSLDHVIEPDLGADLASRLPAAEFRSLEGRAHIPWAEDAVALAGVIDDFLLDGAASRPPTRQLGTVVCVAIVESARLAVQLGDELWRTRLDRFGELVASEAGVRSGRVVADTGDGLQVLFDLPGDAVEFAASLRRPARQLGFGLRTGVHCGEVELRGEAVTGRTVVLASRLCDLAPADAVYLSATTNELAAGRGLRMTEIGPRQLDGVPEPVIVFEAERLDASAPDERPTGLTFERDGAVWRLGFEGTEAVVRHSKGVADLAIVCSAPGQDVDVVELMDGASAPARSTGDNMLDAEAIAAYRSRLGEIEVALDDADERGDADASARLDEEREALIGQLKSAAGLNQRTRRLGDDVERARKAVSGRIRDAVRKIAAEHPALGSHLADHLTTGRYCRYDPPSAEVGRS